MLEREFNFRVFRLGHSRLRPTAEQVFLKRCSKPRSSHTPAHFLFCFVGALVFYCFVTNYHGFVTLKPYLCHLLWHKSVKVHQAWLGSLLRVS